MKVKVYFPIDIWCPGCHFMLYKLLFLYVIVLPKIDFFKARMIVIALFNITHFYFFIWRFQYAALACHTSYR